MLKKLIIIFLIMILIVSGMITTSKAGFIDMINNLISALSVSTTAETGTTADGLKYEILSDGTGVSITDYTGTQTEVVIPEKIENLPVIKIGDSAFAYSDIINVIIPKGVTSIERFAFKSTELTNITISETVTSIGLSAFAYSNLINITIPKNIVNIGEEVFIGCDSLTAITVEEANNNYMSVEGVLYSKDKTTLYCYPKGKKGTTYTIPKGVTEIYRAAFYECSSLTSITIPEGVTTIGRKAFYECNSLTSMDMPKSMTKIDYYAFEGCSSLANIIIPKAVTDIGIAAFIGCDNLSEIIVEEANDKFISIEGVLYNKDKTKLYCYPKKREGAEYTILEEVTEVESYAFYNCESLTNITIPKGVTIIENYTFYNCKNLTDIEIPKNVTSIESNAFRRCSSLTSVTIPEKVTYIGMYAFENCNSLANIVIPEGVIEIENAVFWNCESIVNIICKRGTTAEEYAKENNINYIIDDTAPVVSATYSTTEETEENVIVTITANEKIQSVEGWTLSSDKLVLTKTYTENKTETIIVKDLVGNEKEITIEVEGITEVISKGDINKDGEINITDVLIAQRYISTQKSTEISQKHPDWILDEEKAKKADIDGNGKVDITDVLKVQRYIAAKKSATVSQKHPDWLEI